MSAEEILDVVDIEDRVVGRLPRAEVYARRLVHRPPTRIELASLLEGGREAIIVHNGEDYRLRVTANGKLILTK